MNIEPIFRPHIAVTLNDLVSETIENFLIRATNLKDSKGRYLGISFQEALEELKRQLTIDNYS